jgi:hypothetical protein
MLTSMPDFSYGVTAPTTTLPEMTEMTERITVLSQIGYECGCFQSMVEN